MPRCTAKLLARLKTPPAAAPAEPSTRLGDWYANRLFTRPAHLVLCERTLLPVLVAARELEERAMADMAVGRTSSKRVLGSMNDFAWLVDGYRLPSSRRNHT